MISSARGSRTLILTATRSTNDSPWRDFKQLRKEFLTAEIYATFPSPEDCERKPTLGMLVRTHESFRSENRFSRYLQRTAFVLATESFAAICCSFVTVSEAADLTQVHGSLQIANYQNQPGSPPLQRYECQRPNVFSFLRIG